MTQEQKEKLEQKASSYTLRFEGLIGVNLKTIGIDFKAGAQTILENPGEWGLTYPHSQKLAEEVLSMQSQLTKYRKALESISKLDAESYVYVAIDIADKALKQEDTK